MEKLICTCSITLLADDIPWLRSSRKPASVV